MEAADTSIAFAVSKENDHGQIAQPAFAYPNGKPGRDYRADHAKMVREIGFDAAVSTAHGAARAGSDLYQLPRFTPWDRGSARFMLRMAQNMLKPIDTI